MQTNWEPDLVRATGVCAWCDSHFTDELVARYRARASPSGFAFVELRHLPSDEVRRLSIGAGGSALGGRSPV